MLKHKLYLLAFPVCLILTLQYKTAQAQDTILSRQPQVELIPVKQRDVMDHYINSVWTTEGWKVEVFDGVTVSEYTFDKSYLIDISPNQRYFTVTKPIDELGQWEANAYYVELRNLSNQVLARGQLPGLKSEEGKDEFWPDNDGNGLIQEAYRPFSGGLRIARYRCQEGKLIRQFEVDKSDFWNSNFTYEPAQDMIVATFMGHKNSKNDYVSFVQCYTTDGRLEWEITLDSRSIKSNIFISAHDGTVAFVSRNKPDYSYSSLYIINKNGKIIRKSRICKGGSFDRSYFCVDNGRQYFLCPSEGNNFYVIDTKNGEIVNRQDTVTNGTTITGIVFYEHKIIISYGTRYDKPGPQKNTHVSTIKDPGLAIGEIDGNVLYTSIDLLGVPFLFKNENGLFIREQIGLFDKGNYNYYKLKFR